MVLYNDPSEQKQHFIGQFNPNSTMMMQQWAGSLTASTQINGTTGNGLQARRSPFNGTLQRQLGANLAPTRAGPMSQVLDTDLTCLSIAGGPATSFGLMKKQRQSASHDADLADKILASHPYQLDPNDDNFYQSLDEQQEDALHHFNLRDSQAASSTGSQSHRQTNSNAGGTTNELLQPSHGEPAKETTELSPHRMKLSGDHPSECHGQDES